MSSVTKWLCEECRWVGSEYLTAPNPFDPDSTITGCPGCKDVNTLVAACDEPGCSRPVSGGMQTASGYRFTCHQHAPDRER